MTSTAQTSSNARPQLSEPQMREFIARVKKEKAELVSEGVNGTDLDKRVVALEAALNNNASVEEKAKALENLEAALLPASDGGVTRDVINFFNQLFGTGMPPV